MLSIGRADSGRVKITPKCRRRDGTAARHLAAQQFACTWGSEDDGVPFRRSKRQPRETFGEGIYRDATSTSEKRAQSQVAFHTLLRPWSFLFATQTTECHIDFVSSHNRCRHSSHSTSHTSRASRSGPILSGLYPKYTVPKAKEKKWKNRSPYIKSELP